MINEISKKAGKYLDYAVELLKELKLNGIKLAIVSNKL